MHTLQQALLHLCELLATCVRTQAQRDALDASQSSISTTKSSPESWDTFVLLSSALETAPVQVWLFLQLGSGGVIANEANNRQLAEAIIRTMTALMRDQSPGRGVRLPSDYIGRNGRSVSICSCFTAAYGPATGYDQTARMAERLSDSSRSMRLAAAEW